MGGRPCVEPEVPLGQYQMFTTYSSRMIEVLAFAVRMRVWPEMLLTCSQAITQLAPHTRLAMSVV